MKTATMIASPSGSFAIPDDPTTLDKIAHLNNCSAPEMATILNELLRLKLVTVDKGPPPFEHERLYAASPMAQDPDEDTLCPYKEWTGKPMPAAAEELIEEYERLCAPTYEEFATAKVAAREAVWAALEKFRRS